MQKRESKQGTSLHKYHIDHNAEVASRLRCSALIGSARADHAATNKSAFGKIFMTMRWTGRVGNLLFGSAALLGIASWLNASVPTEAVALNLPSAASTPARQLFENFPLLSSHVHVYEDSNPQPNSDLQQSQQQHKRVKGQDWADLRRQLQQYHLLFPGAAPSSLKKCQPCTFRVIEEDASVFAEAKLHKLARWVSHPPEGCVLGLVELVGYYQSYRYFEPIRKSIIHPALSFPKANAPVDEPTIPTTFRAPTPTEPGPWATVQREANELLTSARRRAASGILIGVQVRLGDKYQAAPTTTTTSPTSPARPTMADAPHEQPYAPATWGYYRAAMKHLAQLLGSVAGQRTKSKRTSLSGVAFFVTAGGSMLNNSADMAEARQHLSLLGTEDVSIVFSPAQDPHVDLTVLRGCDGLVIGPSTLGWWAAYLSRLPKGHVVAPLHIINPRLPANHELRRGFQLHDYYPPHWMLLDNDGEGHVKAAKDFEVASNIHTHT